MPIASDGVTRDSCPCKCFQYCTPSLATTPTHHHTVLLRITLFTFPWADPSAGALPPPWRFEGAVRERRSASPSTLKLEEPPDGQVLASPSCSCISADSWAETAAPSQKETPGELLPGLSVFSRRVAVRVSSWSIAWTGAGDGRRGGGEHGFGDAQTVGSSPWGTSTWNGSSVVCRRGCAQVGNIFTSHSHHTDRLVLTSTIFSL